MANTLGIKTPTRLSLLYDYPISFAFFEVGEKRFCWPGVRAAELNTED